MTASLQQIRGAGFLSLNWGWCGEKGGQEGWQDIRKERVGLQDPCLLSKQELREFTAADS